MIHRSTKLTSAISSSALIIGIGWYLTIFGICVVIGHSIALPILIRGSDASPPTLPAAAAGFIAAGLALQLSAFSYHRGSVVIGWLLSIYGGGWLAVYFSTVLFFVPKQASAVALKLGTPPPQTSFCFLLTGLGLALVCYSHRRRDINLLGLLLGLLAFAVAGIALYGHAFDTRVPYAWGIFYRMGSNAALGFVALAAAVILIGLRQFDVEKASSHDLSKAIEIVSAAGIVLIAAVSSAFGVLPLYQALQENSRRSIIQAADLTANSLNQLFEGVLDQARETSVRRQAKEGLSRFLRGEVERSAYEQQTKARLSAVVEANRTVDGITRVDLARTAVVSAGSRVDYENFTAPAEPAIEFINSKTEGPVILAVSPIAGEDGALLGFDLLKISVPEVMKTAREALSAIPKRGLLFVSAAGAAGPVLIPIRPGEDRAEKGRVFDSTVLPYVLEEAKQNGSGVLEASLDPERQSYLIYSPIRAFSGAVVIQIDAIGLRGAFDKQLLLVVAAVICICFLGAFFFHSILRDLLTHSSRLQSHLVRSTESLERELRGRKRAEALALLHSLENQAIVDNTADAIVTLDYDGILRSFNRAAEDRFGWRAEEIVGKPVSVVLPGLDIAALELSLPNNGAEGRTERAETRAKRRDGTEFPVEFAVGKMVFEGRHTFIGIIRDLTERKKWESELTRSLNEKEMLLKEIHHRVKNNLQVISSMFSLQCRRSPDEETQKILRDSQSRIQSIALLHEVLYRSDSLLSINLGHYLRELSRNIIRSYEAESRISPEFDLAEVKLEIEKAIPCGLIVNELVSNSVKHAFPRNSEGNGSGHMIKIMLSERAEGLIELTVADNGVGVSADVDPAASRTLGLRLVDTLCQQLHGAWSYTSEEGAKFSIKFSREGRIKTESAAKDQQ